MPSSHPSLAALSSIFFLARHWARDFVKFFLAYRCKILLARGQRWERLTPSNTPPSPLKIPVRKGRRLAGQLARTTAAEQQTVCVCVCVCGQFAVLRVRALTPAHPLQNNAHTSTYTHTPIHPYIHAHIHTYTHTHIHTHTQGLNLMPSDQDAKQLLNKLHWQVHVCVCVCVCVGGWVLVCVCLCVCCVCVFVCVCVRALAFTLTHARMHACAHTHARAHTQTHAHTHTHWHATKPIKSPRARSLSHSLSLSLSPSHSLTLSLSLSLTLSLSLSLSHSHWHATRQAPMKSPVGVPKSRLLEARVARDLSMLAPSFALEGLGLWGLGI